MATFTRDSLATDLNMERDLSFGLTAHFMKETGTKEKLKEEEPISRLMVEAIKDNGRII